MAVNEIDIERFKQNKKFSTPEIESYSVEKKQNYLGYQVRLRWEYEQIRSNVIGFKVWRAAPNKVSLRGEYVINQTLLERASSVNKNFKRNTGLYNKQFFSQNSKALFENSGSTRYNQKEEVEEVEDYRFVEIGFVQTNNETFYQFIDKDVKFGKTYLYILTAVDKNNIESAPSNIEEINIEDLSNPDPPKEFSLSLGTNSIIICIDSETVSEDVMSYNIFKKDLNEEDVEFEELAEVLASKTNCLTVIDPSVATGRSYSYKIFTKNMYGNLCLSASSSNITYPNRFEQKQDIPIPSFSLEVNDVGHVLISSDRQSDKVAGLKIERKDVWRYEKDFSVKTFSGNPWATLFKYSNDNENIEFLDNTTDTNRSYQYRVTAIKKNGLPATRNLSSIFLTTPGFSASFGPEADEILPVAILEKLSVNIVDEKQVPIFAEVEWNIEGEWDYLILNVKNNNSEEIEDQKSIRIDNIQDRTKTFIDVLEANNSYTITARVFKDDYLVDSSDESENEFTVVSVDI